jgi:3-oxoadipate enol-lactonase
MTLQRSLEISTGRRLAYSRQGRGPVLILLHPIGMDQTWWSEYASHWQSSYDVIAVDLRGHGNSSLIERPVSLSDHASDVAELIAHEDVSSAHIIGVSMGGMVAQQLAIEAPLKVASLILCATAGGFSDAARIRISERGDVNRAGLMSDVVNETVSRWFRADSPRPDLVKRCRARLLADDWYSWSANWSAIARLDTLAALRAVRVPALVVAGEADASIASAASKMIADAIPSAEFISVPDAAHFGAFDMRESFAPLFDRFLSGTQH